jgi:hypothetical protein
MMGLKSDTPALQLKLLELSFSSTLELLTLNRRKSVHLVTRAEKS